MALNTSIIHVDAKFDRWLSLYIEQMYFLVNVNCNISQQKYVIIIDF